MPFLQFVQKDIGNEQAVGVQRCNVDAAAEDLVNQLPEVPAEHGLAACQRYIADTAAAEGIQHGHQLAPVRLALGCVRRGHETVAASVIAASGNGPLHAFLEKFCMRKEQVLHRIRQKLKAAESICGVQNIASFCKIHDFILQAASGDA